MPSFTYTGTDERYYPTIGLTATPGLIADLASNPDDGRWEPTPSPKTNAKAAPAPVPADPAPTNL